jgi:hypothetical protein
VDNLVPTMRKRHVHEGNVYGSKHDVNTIVEFDGDFR